MKNLNPAEIEQLTWLTREQAQTYLHMSSAAFRDFCKKFDVPYYATTAHPKSRRIYSRSILDKKLLQKMLGDARISES
ncbi:MAG: hypothetical protein KF886_05470 [Candidatus Hydrogenedentes bacterium]|nr:hypothetical protein [Candidatus Hydrogenedentota bacterium]